MILRHVQLGSPGFGFAGGIRGSDRLISGTDRVTKLTRATEEKEKGYEKPHQERTSRNHKGHLGGPCFRLHRGPELSAAVLHSALSIASDSH